MTLSLCFFIVWLIFLYFRINAQENHKLNLLKNKNNASKILCAVTLFIVLYLVPHIAFMFFNIFVNKNFQKMDAYEYSILALFIYILFYIIRFIICSIVSILILLSNNFIKIVIKKYNIVILLVLLMLDTIVYKFLLKNISVLSFISGDIISFLLISVSVVYIPFFFTSIFIDNFFDHVKQKESDIK